MKKNSATRVERNYLPFGLGKHACPGRHFAVNEIKFALHHLLLKYDIKNDIKEKINPARYGAHKAPSDEVVIFEKN